MLSSQYASQLNIDYVLDWQTLICNAVRWIKQIDEHLVTIFKLMLIQDVVNCEVYAELLIHNFNTWIIDQFSNYTNYEQNEKEKIKAIRTRYLFRQFVDRPRYDYVCPQFQIEIGKTFINVESSLYKEDNKAINDKPIMSILWIFFPLNLKKDQGYPRASLRFPSAVSWFLELPVPQSLHSAESSMNASW
jgi:hypothetical protein